MANGMGVEATRVDDCEGFAKALSAGLASASPYLVEVVL
jgi:thiamine pyrophosphate-dependent acetolactate synthase large subunit-like protein